MNDVDMSYGKIIGMTQLLALLKKAGFYRLTKNSIYRMMRRLQFPRPIGFDRHHRANKWLLFEINRWIVDQEIFNDCQKKHIYSRWHKEENKYVLSLIQHDDHVHHTHESIRMLVHIFLEGIDDLKGPENMFVKSAMRRWLNGKMSLDECFGIGAIKLNEEVSLTKPSEEDKAVLQLKH